MRFWISRHTVASHSHTVGADAEPRNTGPLAAGAGDTKEAIDTRAQTGRASLVPEQSRMSRSAPDIRS